MDIDNVKFLAEIVSAYGLTSLEVQGENSRITLKKEIHSVPVGQAQTVAALPSVTAEITPSETSAPQPKVSEPPQTIDLNSRLTEVKSPLVGVFYSAPSPDAEVFVSIGSKVKKGDVMCIIEAMKLMNEITAENDGEVVDICIKNGDIAEFGQVLFKMNTASQTQ
ncbi:MAG: acetyl-CoA carboxylase biotin carboxyl carrier protein [Oscillospiraceae bacterium]|nr:acetyl-CoA carboxylase biotin carboxyl carrier protein [Oscillospiraceae bacterium]